MLPSCLTFPCQAVFLSYQQQCYLLASLFHAMLYSCLTNNNVTFLPHFSIPSCIPVLPTTMLLSCPTFPCHALFLSYQQQCYLLAPLFNPKLYSCLTNNNVTVLPHFSMPSCIPVLPTTMLPSCPTFQCQAVFLSYQQQCYCLAPLFHAMLYSCPTTNNVTFLPHFSMPCCIWASSISKADFHIWTTSLLWIEVNKLKNRSMIALIQ